jgi:MFS family permease
MPSVASTLTREQAKAAAGRNLVLLAGGMAALYGMVELGVGATTLTFEETGGSSSLAGLAPAMFLLSAALSAVPAGRAMDRVGRKRVIQFGFVAGLFGCIGSAVAVAIEWLPLAMIGFALVGVSTQSVLLSRTAAADMYAPDRRPRAISIVLFGAVFGALLGPLVFIPLLQGDDAALDLAWLGAGGFMVAGLLISSLVRPEPVEIARALGHDAAEASDPASLRQMAARPGVLPALVASTATFSAMVTVMTLTGSAMVDHGHETDEVFPVIAAHFVGMFGLFALVGPLIERIGRTRSLAGGLVLLAASCVSMIGAIESMPLTALSLFGVGLGWNLSYVAASAALAESAGTNERGAILGLADMLAGVLGATLAVAGAAVLEGPGLEALAVGVAILPLLSAVWIVRDARPHPTPA